MANLPKVSFCALIFLALICGAFVSHAQVIPSNGLYARYDFSGNANDSSGNNRNATVNGATLTADRYGQLSKAYSFDGSNDYMPTPIQNFASSNGVTLALWFRSAGTNDYSGMFFSRLSNGTSVGGLNTFPNGGVRFRGTNGQPGVDSSTGFFDGRWHHVLGTYDGTTSKIYIDGALASSTAISGSVSYRGTLEIGRDSITGIRFFNGAIDDVLVYDRALSESEIAGLFGDHDSDGLSDHLEAQNATDMTDSDSDDDGMTDGFEVNGGLDPLDASDAAGDLDGDGLSNHREFLIGSNPNLSDTDGDGLSDSDEVLVHSTNPLKTDTDSDGMTDKAEVDNGLNPLLDDAQLDLDGDGLNNRFEVNNGLNPSDSSDATGDLDGDGLSNLREILIGSNFNLSDSDGDGLSDSNEFFVYGTDLRKADTDSDGMTDKAEVDNGLNPLMDDAQLDLDGDGLNNRDELTNGKNPRLWSTLNDGKSDAYAVNNTKAVDYHYDRNDRLIGANYGNSVSIGYKYDANSNPVREKWMAYDANDNGLPDYWEFANGLELSTKQVVDSDGDGWSDDEEWRAGSDPSDPQDLPAGRAPVALISGRSLPFTPTRQALTPLDVDGDGDEDLVWTLDGLPGGANNVVTVLIDGGESGWSEETFSVGDFGVTSVTVGKKSESDPLKLYLALRGSGDAGKLVSAESQGSGNWMVKDEVAANTDSPYVYGFVDDALFAQGKFSGDLDDLLFEITWTGSAWNSTEHSAIKGADLPGSLIQPKSTRTSPLAGAVQRPGSNSWYILTPSAMTWDAAEAWAVQNGGHLATITDAAENAWLSEAFKSEANVWIGLHRTTSNWNAPAWVSGEAFSYDAWHSGEPNNQGGNEEAALFFTNSNTWVDYPKSQTGRGLVEIPGKSTNSNAVIVRKVADGTPLVGAVQRPASSSWYILTPRAMTWDAAEAWAVQNGGHLATITDAAENAWLSERFKSHTHAWIGLRRTTSNWNAPTWISGEAFSYDAWSSGEPNNSGDNEDVAILATNSTINGAAAGGWIDFSKSRVQRGLAEIPSKSTNSNAVIVRKVDEVTPPVTLPAGAVRRPGSNSWYMLTPSAMAWDAAEAWAVQNGGHLATITDAAENAWLSEAFKSETHVWIGLHRTTSNWNAPVWVSGETFSYEAWQPNQPNNSGGNQEAALFFTNSNVNTSSARTWNDYPKSQTGRGLVEIQSPELEVSYETTFIPDGEIAISAYATDTLLGGGAYSILSYQHIDADSSQRRSRWELLKVASPVELVSSLDGVGKAGDVPVAAAFSQRNRQFVSVLASDQLGLNAAEYDSEAARLQLSIIDDRNAGDEFLALSTTQGYLRARHSIWALRRTSGGSVVDLVRWPVKSINFDLAKIASNPPAALIVDQSLTGAGDVALQLRLWDNGSNEALPQLQYYDEASGQWVNATLTDGSGRAYGTTNRLATTPDGATHTAYWKWKEDLSAIPSSLQLRARATDTSGKGPSEWSPAFNYRVSQSSETADLAISGLSLPTGFVAAGDVLNVDLDIENTGSQVFATSEIKLSLNKYPELNRGTPVALGAFPTQSLTVGQTEELTLRATVPASAPEGDYYLFAELNPTNSPAEALRSNNLLRSNTSDYKIRKMVNLSVQTTPENMGTALATPTTEANGKYLVGSTVQLAATAAAEAEFVRWTGAATGAASTVVLTLYEDQTVTAVFQSDDLDSDGVSNVDEVAAKTNPNNPDSDGDGLSDGLERAQGLNPLVASDGFLSYVKANPKTFGLYDETAIRALRVGQPVISLEEGKVVVRMRMKESTDLTDWDTVGEPVKWEFTPTGDAKFWQIDVE